MNNSTKATLAALCVVACLNGCGRPAPTGLVLTSYKNADQPQIYTINLDSCVYYQDAGGDYHFAGRDVHISDQPDGGEIQQLLHVHVFWKPIPGKTFDNASSIDAIYRYVLITQHGVAVYRGTGYVYPRKRRFSDRIRLEVDSGRLSLVGKSTGQADIIEAARLRGLLEAKSDRAAALDIRREIDILTGQVQQ